MVSELVRMVVRVLEIVFVGAWVGDVALLSGHALEEDKRRYFRVYQLWSLLMLLYWWVGAWDWDDELGVFGA